ncbi:hypothetical protein [Deinococcus sedimenti]|nr:hypothetical protein [Deinococcus sedimenti]
MTRPDSPSSAVSPEASGAPTDSGGWQRLDDPAAARVLADAYTRQFFEPFIYRERRVSDVARELGVSTNAMLYRARQFQRLGLLVVTRTEARAGRAVQHYRASSRRYFVPFAATDAATVQALYEESLDNSRRSVLDALTRAWGELADDPRWFGLYTAGDERGLHSHVLLPFPPPQPPSRGGAGLLDALLGDAFPALWDNTTHLHLRPEDAKALQRELRDLHRRFKALSVPDGERHLLRLTLVPLPTDSSLPRE